MINNTVFEILVYSCSDKQFSDRIRLKAEKVMSHVRDYKNGFWQKQLEDEYNRHIKPIRYNQVIGAIEIHILHGQVRADYWFTDKKRIYIDSKNKGTILWQGKLLERNYSGEKLTSDEIFKDFMACLKTEITNTSSFKKRHIDLKSFERVGTYVDWCALINSKALTRQINVDR